MEIFIKESKLYIDSKLSMILNSIDHEISQELLSLVGKETGVNISYLSPDKDNYIYFYDKDISFYDRKFFYNNIKRNKIKLGRLINKIFPSKWDDKTIEEFTNLYISKLYKFEFSLVSGSEISSYYNRLDIKTGSLASSCMTGKSGNYFKIYVDNPESCSMLVLKLDGKFIGRAILWKIHNDNIGIKYLLDKAYTSYEFLNTMFQNWAKENNYAYIYKHQIHHNGKIYSKTPYSEDGLELIVKVKTCLEIDLNYFPYMDTFCVYDYEKGLLYTSRLDSNADLRYGILMDDTGGRFRFLKRRENKIKNRIISKFKNFFS